MVERSFWKIASSGSMPFMVPKVDNHMRKLVRHDNIFSAARVTSICSLSLLFEVHKTNSCTSTGNNSFSAMLFRGFLGWMNRGDFDVAVVVMLRCGNRCCLVPSDANTERILSG